MGTTANKQQSARERARAAKAELDRKRRDADRLIEKAATEFYTASDAADAARAHLAEAENAQAAAVAALANLGQNINEIAELCGLDAAGVKALKKRHQTASQASPDAEQPPLPDATDDPAGAAMTSYDDAPYVTPTA